MINRKICQSILIHFFTLSYTVNECMCWLDFVFACSQFSCTLVTKVLKILEENHIFYQNLLSIYYESCSFLLSPWIKICKFGTRYFRWDSQIIANHICIRNEICWRVLNQTLPCLVNIPIFCSKVNIPSPPW